MMISVVTVSGKLTALAEAAGAPGSAATATATATAASATTAAPATTAASATATAGHLHAALGRRNVLLVEDVERRQADVGDFFHAKRQLMIESKGRGHRNICRRHGGC